MGLDADLTAYYDAEARAGVRGEGRFDAVDIRTRFIDLMRREDRRRLIDVGSGPGRDTLAFQDDGFDTIGVDLRAGERGADADTGWRRIGRFALRALPFANATFDALWTMSTFVHGSA
ncbi:MAG: methyltransferase domain-containing protein [Ilumatobacteraceae bacterium]